MPAVGNQVQVSLSGSSADFKFQVSGYRERSVICVNLPGLMKFY